MKKDSNWNINRSKEETIRLVDTFLKQCVYRKIPVHPDDVSLFVSERIITNRLLTLIFDYGVEE